MPLYNEYEALNERGQALVKDLHRALLPVLRHAIGVVGGSGQPGITGIGSSIEVEHIAIGVVSGICAELRIMNALRTRQLERELKKLEQK